MPTIIIQVGHIGNLCGKELWHLACNELEERQKAAATVSTPEERAAAFGLRNLFQHDGGAFKARAVLVDTRLVTVKEILAEEDVAAWRASNAETGTGGRGQNWAQGYNQMQEPVLHAVAGVPLEAKPPLVAAAMAAIRREVARSEWPVEFVLVHSMTGGSGGGLASRLLEEMRAAFRPAYILSAGLIPPTAAASAEQALNLALSIQWAQRYADAVCLFDQGEIQATLDALQGTQLPRPGDEVAEPGGDLWRGPKGRPEDANAYVARCLAGLLLPLSSDAEGPAAALHPIQDLVAAVCPDPRTKFMEVRTFRWRQEGGTAAAAAAPEFDPMAAAVRPFVPRADRFHQPITTLAAQAYLRGPLEASALPTAKGNLLKVLSQLYNPMSWRHAPFSCRAGPVPGGSEDSPPPGRKEDESARPPGESAPSTGGGEGGPPGEGAPLPAEVAVEPGGAADVAGGGTAAGAGGDTAAGAGGKEIAQEFSITVAANRSSTVGTLSLYMEAAQRGVQDGSLHLQAYAAFGVSPAALQHAIDACGRIRDSYKSALRRYVGS